MINTMPEIKLIALDLDGTLLNSDKRLTERSRLALIAAAERGVEIVPATGRLYRAVPEAVRALPFVRYVITVNGAEVLDLREQRAIRRAEIPLDEALEIMRWLDTLPAAYDCYLDGWGYINSEMYHRIGEYISSPHYLKMIRTFRAPVPELKAFVREWGRDLQKIQIFTQDRELRAEALETLERRFPGIVVTSSDPENVEINHENANKGDVLRDLAAHLGLEMAQTAAFGDGLNDVPMLRAAGVGVAMANAEDAVKTAADRIAASCDEDGAARMIGLLLEEG